jgi:hypothetical protein
MCFQDSLTEFIDFAERDCSESCPLGRDGESADAGKQIKVRWLILIQVTGYVPGSG